MSPKNEIAKKVNELFESLGVDPLVGTTLFGILFSAFTIQDIKKWGVLNSFQKTMYFAIWFSTVIGIITIIVKILRGGM